MPEFLGPFFQEVHFLILFQYLEEEGFEEEVVLTPDVAVVKVAKEKIMNEKTSTCFLQESLYYNLMVYVVGVIFTVSIVAYAVYQTYQVICHNFFVEKSRFCLDGLHGHTEKKDKLSTRTAAWREKLSRKVGTPSLL